MNIDFWYGNNKDDIAKVTCSFSDLDLTYRGNVYDKAGKIIGDFSAKDSVEIENEFPGIFGE